ncbi:MAG: hypothetical protein AAGH72_11180 [Verrucomicrobiota bacterium]
MDFDTVRPVISGIAGSFIAAGILALLAKYLPYSNDLSRQRSIEGNHRRVTQFANVGAGIGIVTGLIFYLGGIFDSNDWRGFGIMMGLTGLLPVTVILFANLLDGTEQIREGFIAYSLSQKTPPVVLFPLLVGMIIFGICATAYLF